MVSGGVVTEAVALFLISGTVIALQIFFMRILSISQWYHFAYLIVSVALLGFGSSGTFLFIMQRHIKKSLSVYLWSFAIAFGISIPLCYAGLARIPFNINEIGWSKAQYGYLALEGLLLLIPFFLAATVIGSFFIAYPKKIARFYAVNLLGSGTGALAGVAALYGSSPAGLIIAASGVALLSSSLLALRKSKARALISLAALGAFFGYFGLIRPPELFISQYKGLPAALLKPHTRHIERRFSPLAMVDVVEDPSFHSAAGLSLQFEGEIPPQLAIFSDADSPSAVVHFQGNFSDVEYLDYSLSALPFHLVEKPRVLVVGVGGGSGALLALYHRAEEITAVEVDPSIVSLLRGPLSEMAGGIFNRQDVKLILAEARGFAESSEDFYDIITMSPTESFAAASAGVYALSENYLLTVESLERFIERLSERGFLSISRWARTPPREEIKLFAMACEALEAQGIRDPSRHLAFLRSWSMTILLIKRSAFSTQDVEKIRRFAEERSFDTIYFPGIRPEETNRFHLLDEEKYVEAVRAILFGEKDSFLRNYPFEIRPATDDQPYFFHYTKWRSFRALSEIAGKLWIPYVEWGYVVLIVILCIGIGVGILLILLPIGLWSKISGSGRARLPTLIYFGCLGIGFMFLEISFFQRFTRFLFYPVYSMAAILTAFLIFSGIGSLFSPKIIRNPVRRIILAVVMIGSISMLYLFFLDLWLSPFIRAHDAVRILTAIVFISPLSFFMGFPFPGGLSRIASSEPAQVPWAWGVNGFASVVGTVLVTLIAMWLGFRAVTMLAVALYAVAAVAQLGFPRSR